MRLAAAGGSLLLVLLGSLVSTSVAQETTDAPIVVDQNEPTAVQTIAEAVEMAGDGDTILVRPGTYTEAVVIDKDVVLAGDGPVSEIIVEAPADGPTTLTADMFGTPLDAEYALLLDEVDATISGLTVRGEVSRIHVDGGSPLLDGLVVQSVGRPYRGVPRLGGLRVVDGSTATISGITFDGGSGIRSFDASEPLVVDNVLRGGAGIAGDFGGGAVIRGNSIVGGPMEGIAILRPTTAIIEGNTITGASTGIVVGEAQTGVDPTVRDNVVCGGGTGISVTPGAAPTITGNAVVGNRYGISLVNRGPAVVSHNSVIDNDIGLSIGRSDANVAGNSIIGGGAGIVTARDAKVTLDGNIIEQAKTHGIVIGRGSSPTLSANRVCHSGVNLLVEQGATPTMEVNWICPPVAKDGEG